MLVLLSSMKKSKSCSCFDGKTSEGKGSLCVFDSSVWRLLVEFEEPKSPVKLSNCEVKCLRLGEELEILVAKCTEVTKSGKVFDVESSMRKAPGKVIQWTKLHSVSCITVEVKVLHMEEAKEVSGDKKKQNIMVGGSTGGVRCMVWEDGTRTEL